MSQKKLAAVTAVSQGSTAPEYQSETMISTNGNLNESGNLNTSNNQNQNTQSSRRNPAIDGLRALAIVGIVCFHMRPVGLQGGFLGVTLFLVLAGYFCTRTILRSLSGNSGDSRMHYWKYLWHRIIRIFPSTLGIIAVFAPVMWLMSPSLLPKLQSDALYGASFTSNISYIVRKLSYFEQAGLPSPIKHLWYLGIIMQAFVIWPLLLWIIVKVFKSKTIRVFVTLLLTLASSATCAFISCSSSDYMTPARVYYALDTRASEFLVGALVAMCSSWFANYPIRALFGNIFDVITKKQQLKTVIKQLDQHALLCEQLKYQNVNSTNGINGTNNVNAVNSFNVTNSNFADNIPEDLRAGLQIDMYDGKGQGEYYENSSQNYAAVANQNNPSIYESDIVELPDDVFNREKERNYTPSPAWQRSIIGIAAVAVLCWLFVKEDGTSLWLPRGGYTAVAILCAVILSVCKNEDNLCSKIFAFAPFAYLGKRSFALYLVHFPILEVCNPATRTTLAPWWEQVAQFVLSLIVAECFYRIFEMPVTHKQFSLSMLKFDQNETAYDNQINSSVIPATQAYDTAQNMGQNTAENTSEYGIDNSSINVLSRAVRTPSALRQTATVVCAALTVILIVVPLNWKQIAQDRAIQLRPELAAPVQEAPLPGLQNPNGALANKNGKATAKAHRKKFTGKVVDTSKIATPPAPSKHRILNAIAEKVPENLITSHSSIDSTKGTCSAKFTMVGDSITEGAKPYLLRSLPNAFVDGKVSRQIFHGAESYIQDINNGHPGEIVVYALGTNGPPHDESVLQHMVDVAKGRPVYFVTTRVPQPWQDTTNDRLRKFAAKHPNVGIIDWHGLSNGHSEYLTDDGVHLTPVGGPQYARMIRLAVCGG